MRRAAACVPPSLLRSFRLRARATAGQVGGTVGAALIIITASEAAAQDASPPGPWVVDVRAVTSPVPTDSAFYPALATDFVPSRGFGVDVGAHFYLFSVGPARVGLGGNLVTFRSSVSVPATTNDDGTTAPGQRLTLTMRTIAPQVSFNFGSADGWSYLSAGVGASNVNTEASEVLPGQLESGRLRSVNFGGGARWFIKPRLAFGFDLRGHRVASGADTPGMTVLSVGVGMSIR